MKKKIHLSNLIIYFLCCLSLVLSFYFNEDGSFSPLSGDFKDTWPYVLKLKENIFSDPYPYTVHYPLHYYLLSRLSFIFDDPTSVRVVFFIISIFFIKLIFLLTKLLK